MHERRKAERSLVEKAEAAIDEKKARAYKSGSISEEEDQCTMCGEFCAIKRKY